MRRLSIELPDNLHQQIKTRASQEGLSMRAYVLRRLGLAAGANVPPQHGGVSEPDVVSGSMRELLLRRPWQGEATPAEIEARLAAERADWHDES